MKNRINGPEKIWVIEAKPEREELVCSCCAALGYRLEKARRDEHADTELIFFTGRRGTGRCGKDPAVQRSV